MYEKLAASGATGDFLRPGGLALTERALSFCSFSSGARILDVGCGAGGTVEYLINHHRLRAVGVDPSSVLLGYGRRRGPCLPLVLASGEDLPFADSDWDGVFVECSLSVAKDAGRVLGECSRVLRAGGRLILSDVYSTNPGVNATGFCLPSSCRAIEIVSREELTKRLNVSGFQVTFWEDQSRALKEFVAQLILSNGSVPQFWCPVDHGKGNGEQFPTTFEFAAGVKPGYFLCVAQKSIRDMKSIAGELQS
ncbi:MAG TPA: methyltransferase domain-containing protein [Deltaproteobacteria bacterium]|nr:methyltransferase domain-containing protein [Deltaproteobacteria bacterium]